MSTKKARRKAAKQERKSRKWNNLATVLLAGAVVAGGMWYGLGLWSPAPEIGTAAPEMLVQGQALYAKNCASCHGPGAAGQNAAQPKGGINPDGSYLAPALNGTAHAWHHAPGVLFDIVRDGSPVKESPMRGWKERMNDEEIQAVLAYLVSLWPEPIRARYRKTYPMG